MAAPFHKSLLKLGRYVVIHLRQGIVNLIDVLAATHSRIRFSATGAAANTANQLHQFACLHTLGNSFLTADCQEGNFFTGNSGQNSHQIGSLIAQSITSTAERKTKVSNENLEKVLSLMYESYNKPIDIKKYAAICFVGEDHFIRVFKAYTGLTPYTYQLKIRIDRAVEMLENTAISVGECAEVVGFGDNAYFSKVFKRFTGHSPSYYKK